MQGPTVAGLLTIPSECNLYITRITPGQGYSLSVLGNDGKHSDVISTVTVEFLSFDNNTIDNSITLQVANTTAQQFLSNSYRGLVDILKSTLTSSDTLSIFSLQEAENHLHITVGVRSAKGYNTKSYITERFIKKQIAINQLLMRPVYINYSPCNENTCENNGICSEAIHIKRTTKITDSQNIIFTSPELSHDYTCHCTDGFTGMNCQKKQDPCAPNPCKSGAQCRRQGYNFQCICPSNKDGKYCELERGDVCLENPCQNGGSCRENPDGSSYFCLCRPGYRGNQCEALVDSCRPNPCLNGGLCVSMKPGYKCSCTDGRYGQHCEKSTFSFKELSYMIFPPLDAATNDISFIFATTKADSLLIYNYGLQTGGRSDFVAVELVNGKAVFSFGGARTAITSIKVAGKENNLANGKWYKITATRNGRVVSLSVSSCLDQGDTCEDCKPGDMSCYADDIGPAGTLNFNNQPLLIGGLNNADPILERPGQVHSDDLVGCVHSVSINGRQLNLSNPIQAYGVDHSCLSHSTCQQTSEDACLDSTQCIDRWYTLSCNCGDNLIAPNCRSALQPISMSDGGYIEYTVSKKHRRMQLLEAFYGGSTLWQHHRQIRSNVKDTTNRAPVKSVSFMFRTVRDDGVLFYATSNKHLTAIELKGGQLHYISKLATIINMTDSHHIVTDGQWHMIALFSQAGGLKIMLDDIQIGDELDTVGVHDFLDAYLTSLSLGGVRSTLYYSDHKAPQYFEGCIANFTINNEIQPFNGSGSIFDEVTIRGHVVRDCNGPVGLGAVAAPDPLSIGITLVIVFFVVLLIAILVSFVVFRLRKQNKEKDGVTPGGVSPAMKQQNGGNHTILASNGLVVSSVNDNVLSRSLHSNDTSLGYHSENGDVIRGISGHPLVGPELLSKKFKEQRDILQGELPRPQRPDIIEREVLTKSPPMRTLDDAHHPPLPPTSNHMHHDHTTDMNSEVPEHYDLENASSIAPSDIDIVYHYKGYREAAAAAAAAAAAGGGMRKYKATPPPVGYHHKHTSAAQAQAAHQQHRHSPHHPGVGACYPPPRAPGVGGPGGGSGGCSGGRQPPTHQSTPLARLSPSSEMSAQQPRILTLHDISGKPLQSALLATTTSSSGGGVGKDVLHSNSERSLNSPVMSQLSGQSSNNNRKVNSAPVPSAPSPAGIGLTAEEIERLNSRPRNSSLVSTLDAVSSSSEAVPRGNVMNHHLVHQHQHTASPPVPPPDHAAHHRSAPPTGVPTGSASTGTTSTDESGNDSFTCSEIEYDNASLNEPDDDDDKYKPSVVGGTSDAPPLPRHHNNNSSNSTLSVTGNSTKNNGLLSPTVSYHDGFDSSYRGSMSTLVASDDEIGGPLYHHPHHHRASSHDGGSSPPSSVATAAAAAALGWDYLLNWGPNFESLAGVFKDIAELPDTVPTMANGNGGAGSRLPAGLRLTNAPKPSEEYV